MKRNWICLMLAVLLAASLIPALGEEAEPSPVGDWYTDIEGMPLCLTLKEDGTYASTFLGQETDSGVWEEEDGLIYLDGVKDTPILFTGETLVQETDEMIFTREAPAELYVPAPVMEAEKMVPLLYEGNWGSEYIELDGVLIPVWLLGESTELMIDAEPATIEGDGENAVVTAYGDATVIMAGELFGYTTQRFVFDEETGALVLNLEGTDATITLQLLQDGELKLIMETPDVQVNMYLSRLTIEDDEDAEGPVSE